MAGRLAGKGALISGAARGQGEVEGRLFAQEGAKVVLGDILVDLGKKVADDIQQQGGQATFVALDVTKEANWQSMVRGLFQSEGRQAVVAAHPLRRMGASEDIAYGVLYLASDESSFVTGSELVIDGGFTAQ